MDDINWQIAAKRVADMVPGLEFGITDNSDAAVLIYRELLRLKAKAEEPIPLWGDDEPVRE